MKIVESINIYDVRPLFQDWIEQSRGDEFGLIMCLDDLDESLQQLVHQGGVLLIAYDQDSPVGWLALSQVPSFSGPQMIAYVTFWYSSNRSKLAGPRLMDAAKNWAVSHDCSHLFVGASRLASNSHDSICRYMERTGAKQFETIYIWECQ